MSGGISLSHFQQMQLQQQQQQQQSNGGGFRGLPQPGDSRTQSPAATIPETEEAAVSDGSDETLLVPFFEEEGEGKGYTVGAVCDRGG